MKNLREALSDEKRQEYGQKIAQTVVSGEEFLTADTLLVYMQIGSEVRTDAIIQTAIKLGKKVYVPKVTGREMDFYLIHGCEECTKGFMGIPEPSGKTELFIPDSGKKRECTLMLLPGLAFDTEGKRLGYGGGFYDRYLAKCPNCVTMGIAYDFQCEETLPTEETDKNVDIVITEKRIMRRAE
jgi:5-formyltetrahydrofolate cyclo-ligase